MGLAFTVLYLFFFGLFCIFKAIAGPIQAKNLHDSFMDYQQKMDKWRARYENELVDDRAFSSIRKMIELHDIPRQEWREEYIRTLGLSGWKNVSASWKAIAVFELAVQYRKVPDYDPFSKCPCPFEAGTLISNQYLDEGPEREYEEIGSQELHILYKVVSQLINKVHPEYYICRYTVHNDYGGGYYVYKWNVLEDPGYNRNNRRYKALADRRPVSELTGFDLAVYRFDTWGKFVRINGHDVYYTNKQLKQLKRQQ